jgi:threonine dehydratase
MDLERIVKVADHIARRTHEASAFFAGYKDLKIPTPLVRDDVLSENYNCNVYLKREDQTLVRSYKLRGALFFVNGLSDDEKSRGLVCASAGNHAQGIALSCNLLGTKGHIFMPIVTPSQKVERVKYFGNSKVQVHLEGDTFDDVAQLAIRFAQDKKMVYAPPFDNPEVVAGQGTVTKEIVDILGNKLDYVINPIGGGGLISGTVCYLRSLGKDLNAKVLGVEHEGALTMKTAIKNGKPTPLDSIDRFVDGTAVKLAGELTYSLLNLYGLDEKDIISLNRGEICQVAVKLHDRGIHAELAGAMSVAALDKIREDIKGKNVACIISGGNIGADRWNEVVEESLIHQGKRKYVVLTLPDRPKAFQEFLTHLHGKGNLVRHYHEGVKDDEGRSMTTAVFDLDSSEVFDRLKAELPSSFTLEDISKNRFRKLLA